VDKKFKESKKAIGFCVGLVCLVITYIGGSKLGLAPAMIESLGMKIMLTTGVYIGGQAFVDMLKQAISLIASLKKSLVEPK